MLRRKSAIMVGSVGALVLMAGVAFLVTRASGRLITGGPAARVVASTKRHTFHRLDCKWARNIKSENRVELTREDAVKRGFSPCATCKP